MLGQHHQQIRILYLPCTTCVGEREDLFLSFLFLQHF
nr:MAG TPA: hypothetical protein [Caudoviricetes sp.]